MEIRNLRTFIKVADVGNLTQAAKELGYSQSNVSTQIIQLESEIGVQLFDRIGKGVSLTQQGRDLLNYAQTIVNTADLMSFSLKGDNELGGEIKVGIIESLFEVWFPGILKQFISRFPKVKIDLDVDSSTNILDKLRRNALDIGVLIDFPLEGKDWNVRFRKSASSGIIVGDGHRFFGKKTIKADELKNEKFILMEETAPYLMQFYDIMAGKNLDSNTVVRMQSADMAAKIVEDGNFVSFMPEYVVRKQINENKISFIMLDNYIQTQEIQVVAHNKKSMTPQINGFIETVGKVLEM